MSEPTTTKALLVGIEKYEAGESWNLNGPAHDVIRMAEWLISKKVPPENLTIFLSPLDNNQATIEQASELTGSEPATASQSNIHDELRRLWNQPASLFFFYWGGHGWVTPEGKRRLFFDDARQRDERHLDFDNLLASLRGDCYRQMQQQLFVVDTCADYIKQIQNPPNFTLSIQSPLFSPEQFVLFAGKLGDRAKNLDSEQTGLYTRELLRELYDLPPSRIWPPYMEAIAYLLKHRFDKLRSDGLAEQIPTYIWKRGWQGQDDILESSINSNSSSNIRGTKKPYSTKNLSYPQKVELRNKLTDCQGVKKKARRDLIFQELLKSYPQLRIQDRMQTSSLIMNLLDQLQSHEYALEKFIEIIKDEANGQDSTEKDKIEDLETTILEIFDPVPSPPKVEKINAENQWLIRINSQEIRILFKLSEIADTKIKNTMTAQEMRTWKEIHTQCEILVRNYIDIYKYIMDEQVDTAMKSLMEFKEECIKVLLPLNQLKISSPKIFTFEQIWHLLNIHFYIEILLETMRYKSPTLRNKSNNSSRGKYFELGKEFAYVIHDLLFEALRLADRVLKLYFDQEQFS
ncbi:MAG: caspase family protein [Microcystis sp. M04BS1]|nr:caspase family protein [Microcystis sp. M04BS1]